MAGLTKKVLKQVHRKLKKGYKGTYINMLVTAMNSRKEEMMWEKEINNTTIYNIFNGLIVNKFLRTVLYEESVKLLDQFNKTISDSESNTEKILEKTDA